MIDIQRYDPVPSNGPPSYDAQESAPGFRQGKQDSSVVAPGHLRTKSMDKGSSRWFSFRTSNNTKKIVQSIALNLVRDIVKQPSLPTGSASDLLECLSETCQSHGISFSSLLQQKSIANHTPLFWAVVLGRHSQHSPDADDLTTTLLSHSTPLMSSTIAELRHACLLACDQALFQRFKLSSSFSPLSGTDQMILGTSICPDSIEVKEVFESETGVFVVDFKMLEFQKRMRVSNRIELEFIARGKIVNSTATRMPCGNLRVFHY
jgi:hypothetical protein